MQTVFKRREIKYLVTLSQFENFLKDIAPYTKRDKYYETDVMSIYFDTDTDLLIRRSIEKPTVYKEKLRLRCYGEIDENTYAFAEIKKKFKGIVYKRREILPYKVAKDFLYNRITPENKTQIIKEIDYMMDFYDGLKPKMALFYKRKALVGTLDSSLRITADTNILWRSIDLNLEYGVYGRPLLDNDKILIEIKCQGAIPLWLVEILSKNKIYPTAFSKYGKAYQQKLFERNKIYDTAN